MRKRVMCVAAALAVIIAACGGTEPAAEPSASMPDATNAPAPVAAGDTRAACAAPVVVGVVTDLSGGSELFGSQLSRGVQIGMAFAAGSDPQEGEVQTYRVGDCEYRVITSDDQSNPEVAAIVARKLIDEDGATVLIGSVGQDTTAAIADVAQEAGVVFIATTDTADGLTAEGFRTNTYLVAPSLDQEAMALCEHVVDGLGATRIAQIAPDYGYGQRIAAARSDACVTLGAQFVVDDVLPGAATSAFEPILEPIRSADVEALLIAWTGGGLKRLVAAASAAELEPQAVFGSHRLVPVFYADSVGMTSPVAYQHEAAANAANSYLIAEIGLETGGFPDIHDARGMTAALVVVAGMRAAEGSGLALSTLEGVSVEGPGGLVTIRSEDHTAIQDIPIVELVSSSGPDFFDFISSTRPEPLCRLTGEHAARCP